MSILVPKDLEQHAQELASSGLYGSTPADVVRAAFRALDEQAETEEEQAALQVAADTAALAAYLARRPGDPHDMSREEVLACLNSADPEKHRTLGEHFQALCDDIDSGKIKTVDGKKALALISAELGLD